MADPAQARSVYRYFDLADSFVQILLSDAETFTLPDRPGMNRAGYRRVVIERCMPEFADDIEAALETLFPEDPLMVEDLLYQLCVEVNPHLDIHEVRLSVDPGAREGVTSSTESMTEPWDMERFLHRLRRQAEGLERRLREVVIGQDEAIECVVRAVRRAAAGLASDSRPLSSLLFTGRTGTGKTELARTLARELFDDRQGKNLVRIDCSEYALAHEYSKLIGSPPGYVGHDEGGQLTDAVADNPECVVLFDEIEKAHPRLTNLLLQVLEEGSLTDGKGRRVSFGRAIVILTSNAGAGEILRRANGLGFGRERALGQATLRSITQEALEHSFSPEFLGRIDDTVLFHELTPPVVERIAARKLYELAQRSRGRGVKIAFTPAVARWVAVHGFSPDSGARELRRVVQREIEPVLSDVILAGDVGSDELVRVRVRGGELWFDIEQ